MATTHGARSPDIHIANEGVFSENERGDVTVTPPPAAPRPQAFHYARIGPRGRQLDRDTLRALAAAMAAAHGPSAATKIPSAFTYLGQLIGHEMTFAQPPPAGADPNDVTLIPSARSPSLDLDVLYGSGPAGADAQCYDGPRLVLGPTQPATFPAGDPVVATALDGCDLARAGAGDHPRFARIPDPRDDTNLSVASLHLALIRFHNAVVRELEPAGGDVFARAKDEVVRHYQWMIREDFLKRVCDPALVDQVFTTGTRILVAPAAHGQDLPLPAEFAMAGFRFGHSMVRGTYEWNRVFQTGGPGGIATLAQLANLTGFLGTLSADGAKDSPFLRLPTNWVLDWRHMIDFPADLGRADLAAPRGLLNLAEAINSLITPPLAHLPQSFLDLVGGAANLAERNLMTGRTISLASGQQMAKLCDPGKELTKQQILDGKGGADLSALTAAQRDELAADTPLWFYVLREAEVLEASQRLGPVGSRIVVETIHRAIEASQISIVRDAAWRPTRGAGGTFKLAHLVLAGGADKINPLG